MGEAKRKGPVARHKIDLDWAFTASLQPSQLDLIGRLKPDVVAWSTERLPFLQARLAMATDATQATMETRLVNAESVWMFNAMIHNRDIGVSVVAMVATTEGDAEKMADAFMRAAETRMGKPTSAVDGATLNSAFDAFWTDARRSAGADAYASLAAGVQKRRGASGGARQGARRGGAG